MCDKKEFRRGSYGKETKKINEEIINVGLVTAINMGDLNDVKDIVETKNIDVNDLGQEYRPALTVASIEGQIEIAKYLNACMSIFTKCTCTLNLLDFVE